MLSVYNEFDIVNNEEGTELNAINLPTLRRLPRYLKALVFLSGVGQKFVTSAEMSGLLKLDETLVRKDIAMTGFTGKPRVGFAISELRTHLEEFLGLHIRKDAIVIGAGRLGQALTCYHGFEAHGLRVVGIFDSDPVKMGLQVNDLEIMPMWQAPALARRKNVSIAIIAVPANAAQEVAENLFNAGLTAFWNFSGHPVKLPAPAVVQNEDLADSLAVFSYDVVRQLKLEEKV